MSGILNPKYLWILYCNRSAYANNLVVSQTFIYKYVTLLPLFATLLLTDEAPYVDVIVPYFA